MRPSNKLSIAFLALASVITIGLGSRSPAIGEPAPIPSCASPDGKTVSMVIKNPDGSELKIASIPWVQNMNVHLAMLNAQQAEPKFSFATSYFCPYGAYVTSIDGFTEGGDHYWALYVNGTFAQFGIDTQLLNSGDKITWVVESTAPAKDRETSHQTKLLSLHLSKRIDKVMARAAKP